MKLQRLMTLRNALGVKVKKFEFEGDWADAFGQPQAVGVWFVYGNSGHGKTSFVLMLIKKLAQSERVLFVSYEEGTSSASLQEGILKFGLLEVEKRAWICTDSLEELEARLSTPRSPDVIVIDSLEHSEIKSVSQLASLSRKFKNKLFVIVGQAEGNLPVGKLGHDVLHYANQKIRVEGYRALSRGRSMGSKKYLTIWEEEAKLYWDK
jgi:Cdc6-like AAA superfamily ATPase